MRMCENLLVFPPLLVNVEVCEVVTFWHLKLLSCCIGVIFTTFRSIEDCRNRQH